MRFIRFTIAFAILSFMLLNCVKAQTSALQLNVPVNPVPWTPAALIEPSTLAAQLKAHPESKILILNIGAVEDIDHATHIGPVSKSENLEKLLAVVKGNSKSAKIVIYCGCCPFGKCPNIRPAYRTLKEAGFTNISVLNLPVNLKTDWIAKQYPLKTS